MDPMCPLPTLHGGDKPLLGYTDRRLEQSMMSSVRIDFRREDREVPFTSQRVFCFKDLKAMTRDGNTQKGNGRRHMWCLGFGFCFEPFNRIYAQWMEMDAATIIV